MAAVLEYLGLNALPLPTTTSGGGAASSTTLTFAPASSKCRARHLWLDYAASGDEEKGPFLPATLGYIFVAAIRVNGGPNLVTGLIPIGCFAVNGATSGFPAGELNIPLNAADVVTVEITDFNSVAQVGITYSGQIKLDSASSTTSTNTAASVTGPVCYWLGAASNPILEAGATPGAVTWTSAPAPVELYLDYWYNFQSTASSQNAGTFKFLVTSLTISGSPTVNYVDGLAAAGPQAGFGSESANMGVGQQCRIKVPAGETVTMTFTNVAATPQKISLGWSVLANG